MPIIPALKPRRMESVPANERDSYDSLPDGKSRGPALSQPRGADDPGRLSVSRLQQDALAEIQNRDYLTAITKEHAQPPARIWMPRSKPWFGPIAATRVGTVRLSTPQA